MFAALVPPAVALDELEAAVGGLGDPELRWSGRTQWHVTLAFYGEVPQRTLGDLRGLLSRVAAARPAPTLSLGGGGRFGDRVLWTRVGGDTERLGRTAARAQAAGRRAGLSVDPRRYRPHLTLARARTGTDLRPFVARLGGFTGTPWVAADLHLMSSTLEPGTTSRPVYATVASWPFSGQEGVRR
ncbi:MAG: RNA 2',3'-cyclic phosphodiesterase [Pseudonocardia sp.]|nr:RNA 2',3'-cyclic phosphodiesterase [Pseudonocardia sp.]